MALVILCGMAYLSLAVTTAMVINGSWNKRCGPGGSARRLHHPLQGGYGGDTGSTRVVKTCFLPGMIPLRKQ